MCSYMKLFSLWSDFCHCLYKYCGDGGPRIMQICWEDGHKTCPWARDYYRVRRTHPVKFIFIFPFDWDWCLMFDGRVRFTVWNAADGKMCDNLMFHTSIYGSPVRPVILIANEIIASTSNDQNLELALLDIAVIRKFSPSNKKYMNLL